MKRGIYILVVLFVSIFSSVNLAKELTEETYAELKDKKGVVVVAINWGRKWKCANFENAQFEKLIFELMPIESSGKGEFAKIDLTSPLRLFVDNKFLNYAFIVDPGVYALSEFSIKVAKSSSDVGYLKVGKDKLIKDGEPYGGSITVKAGEAIYIGHFFIDCYRQPLPWRYYPDGRNDFNEFIKKFKEEFGYLSDADIKFRLFDTKHFGNPYELPE